MRDLGRAQLAPGSYDEAVAAVARLFDQRMGQVTTQFQLLAIKAAEPRGTGDMEDITMNALRNLVGMNRASSTTRRRFMIISHGRTGSAARTIHSF